MRLAGRCAGLALLLAAPPLVAVAATPATHDPYTRLSAAQRADGSRQVVVTIDDARAPRMVAAPGATPRAPGGGAGYRGSPRAQALARAIAGSHGLEWVAAWRIDLLGVHCIVYRIAAEADRETVLASLRADARVESAQPMQSFATSARLTPAPPSAAAAAAASTTTDSSPDTSQGRTWDDPYFPLQSALRAMRVPEAQRIATGRAVRIAVIDTGADTAHPDLAPRIAHAANFVDTDAAHFRSERHGTAVAGAIAAVGDNHAGIVGVAPDVRLTLLKACWQDAPALPGSCNTLTLAEALSYAIERRVQVVNLSLAGPPDSLLERLLRHAVDAGIVVLAADPRRDPSAPAPFPVAIPGVLGVRDADASSGGSTPAAPGKGILTTVPGGRYDYVSGASMSVALASGVVALLLERRPGLSVAELGRLLHGTAATSTAPAALTSTIDAAGAIRALAASPERSGPGNTRVAAGTPACRAAGRPPGCR